MSVLADEEKRDAADEEKRDAADESRPPDQEALGITLLLMRMFRSAHESKTPTGSLERRVGRVAPDAVKGT